MGENNINDKKTIISNIKTKVKYVDNINDIPNTQIYWIKDLQQFGIRARSNIYLNIPLFIIEIQSNSYCNTTICCTGTRVCEM